MCICEHMSLYRVCKNIFSLSFDGPISKTEIVSFDSPSYLNYHLESDTDIMQNMTKLASNQEQCQSFNVDV